MPWHCQPRMMLLWVLLALLPAHVAAVDILKTSGFSSCAQNSDIKVTSMNIEYNRLDNTITFDVAGTSSKVQSVQASLIVTAYGRQVYQKDFDPCDNATKVDQLCPVPAGNFAAKGSQTIPADYAAMIPAIAFQIPDLDGEARLELKADGKQLACIQSTVSNGKTLSVPAVSYVAVGIAGAALALTGVSALGSAAGAGATGGTGAPSPSFGEVIGWFQSVAINGMLSVNYPPVYRSFSKNFGFSSGLVSWTQMQQSIDNFRKSTGGNLTEDNIEYLQNATLVYTDGSSSTNLTKRSIDDFLNVLLRRDLSTTINGTTTSAGGAAGNSTDSNPVRVVHGIQAYAEQLTIPQANTFMTVLLIFAIVIAAVVIGILLFKVILEVWALCASFPKGLTGFRKRYWGTLARTIVNLILILYGVWTLYCVYEITHGDSWAAKVLAGVTFAIFTGVLGFFTFTIWKLARKSRQKQGSASALYEDKNIWRRYSLFYDQYKKDLWWIFIPTIIYLFAKGCVIAAGDGHGMAQTIGQIAVEAIMLVLLVWNRPYEKKSGNWINIFIQIARVLSAVCILVFVEELGIAKDTKTITGVVLIAVQSVLTGALAILIAVNALIICCRQNPHRKRRKEAEKINRDLTPLDARNLLLVEPNHKGQYEEYQLKAPLVASYPSGLQPYRDEADPEIHHHPSHESREHLNTPLPMGYHHERSFSYDSQSDREPRLPNIAHAGPPV
ncbi:MAG: hypothetical protein M1829_004944 [Trizodia sp. TS-e1964]|nr:MAG: hypothetical protein M1829_004944 [Trizodia sp. TS-e1964]